MRTRLLAGARVCLLLLRQKNKMNKIKIRKQLEIAARLTNAKNKRFQGVYIYGSFATDKPDPNDVDLIPVFDTYRANRDFSAICKMERCFESHFPELPKEQWIHRRDGVVNKRIIHIGRGLLAYLSNREHLGSKLSNFRIQPENFIGTDEAAHVIKEVLAGAKE